MQHSYSIHPSIGVARLGNSDRDFYLAPDGIGALPTECDAHGNAEESHGRPIPVKTFKDGDRRVRRQAQKFRIFRHDPDDPGGPGEELTLDSEGVNGIEWTVHLANKKAAWHQFKELEGNLLLGEDNSYASRAVPWRNPKVEGGDRQKLIIDPGPRTISGRRQSVGIDRDNPPDDYPFVSFPNDHPEYGYPINTLGCLKTDDRGRLLVLGGLGHAGGDKEISSYGGADSWHDDISDGQISCVLRLGNGESHELKAWVIVGSPDFVPEIVNISTLDDTMFDVAVRAFGLVPDLYADGAFNDAFVANFQRDILPIIERTGRYQWVANVQSMTAFTGNPFDFSDNSEANRANREAYFSHFRRPGFETGQHQVLFADDGVPMMPLNSASNSVSNVNVEKFLTLDETQYFFLRQWARGRFESNPEFKPYKGISPLDRISVGNCVGLPQCPGIEVTWSVQNPRLYEAPYVVHRRAGEDHYREHGLDPNRDECEGGGCEPGDLTKRMAVPWQADFFNCTIQLINFTDPGVNKEDGQPKLPNYYSYWWPPQSPWDVLTDAVSADRQKTANVPAGVQVNFARGINSYTQMITSWWYLGFVRNRNGGADSSRFPYFVETERYHEMFDFKAVKVSEISGHEQDGETTIPVFFLKRPERLDAPEAKLLRAEAEERMFRPIATAPGGPGMPRSGTRNRY